MSATRTQTQKIHDVEKNYFQAKLKKQVGLIPTAKKLLTNPKYSLSGGSLNKKGKGAVTVCYMVQMRALIRGYSNANDYQ